MNSSVRKISAVGISLLLLITLVMTVEAGQRHRLRNLNIATTAATPTPTPAPAGDAGEASIAPDGSAVVTSQGTGTVTAPTPPPPSLRWYGVSPGTPPQVDEQTNPVDGANHDYFILTVNGTIASWAGKQISVKIDWPLPASDYDLHVHKDTEFGEEVYTSAGGAPSTEERVAIDPSVTGVGVYYINVGYFTAPSTPNDPSANYTGTASVVTSVTLRSATYQHGGITFSPNTPVKAGTASSDGEPSSRVDGLGNYYISGIRGVPAGVDLWYFDARPTLSSSANPNYDPNLRVPLYRGQPDSVFDTTLQSQLSAGALGGGDIDLAIGFGPYTGAKGSVTQNQEVGAPVLAYSSLTAANLTLGTSLDRGQTFAFNPVGNIIGGVPVNDREWLGFFNDHVVYQVYRNFAQGLAFVQQSTNGGFSYGPALPAGGITFPQTGSLEVDRTDGTVYVSSNDGQVAVGLTPTPDVAPLTYTIHRAVPASVDSANIFFPIRVADDHTIYGTYSDGRNIFLVHSTDHAVTWSNPVQVNDSTDLNENLNLMPWLAAGPTPGSVAIVWYATDHDSNDDNARWRVYFAQTFNGAATTPAFRIVQASDHSNHAANISLKGLPITGPSPNRNLIDYFQVNIDPQGAAIIGYADDHNDFDGHTFVTRQITGPSFNGTGSLALPAQTEGSALPVQPFALPGATPPLNGKSPQPMQPGPDGEQVTDFAYDQDSGLLAVTPTASAIDIISIKYTSQDSNAGPVLTATMKVSDLSAIPNDAVWRMHFTVNAPETGIVNISGNSYSKGLSDDGDMFFVQASTNASGVVSYKWGTTVREYKGTTTDTVQGTATRGFMNQQDGTITVRMATGPLNTYLAGRTGSHPAIGFGSTLCGLRGNTFVGSSAGLEDNTRGGTEYTIANPF